MPGNNHAQIPTHWYDRILHEQRELIDKIETTPAAKTYLKQTLAECFGKTCPICHLEGHEAAACWINTQMFKETRSKPDYKLAWWQVK